MADRKQFMTSLTPSRELLDLMEKTKDNIVSEEVLQEQRISFAYGNAPADSGITKESVRKTASSIRIGQ